VGRNEDGGVQVQPPEGAILGVYAGRALARGGWIAPANERLRDVLALRPVLGEEDWQGLLEAQVNVVRQAPRGFLALAADTLSDDPDLRPVNVRRLLILLRRLALRRGATYVFEPHSDELRRLVQRGFEAVMRELFERGAFAGATPASAFRVVTDESVNPRQSRDAGRFIVELRVAPALPLTFITLRLAQRGDRLVVVEGR
jgi:phage tail sheath protein FI